jgi:hypothetical protein
VVKLPPPSNKIIHFCPVKLGFPSCATTGAWCSSLPCLWHSSVHPGLFRGPTCDNVMVQGHDCDNCTSKICDGLCEWSSIFSEEQHFRNSCRTDSTKVNIWTFQCFNMAIRVQCCAQSKKFTRLKPVSSQKIVTMIFAADGTLLNFFFLGDVV